MLRHIILATAITVLAGCGSSNNIRDTDRKVNQSEAVAETAVQTLQSAKPRNQPSVTFISGEQFVATKPIAIDAGERMPGHCTKITYSPSNGMTLLEVGQLVSKLCGVPVRVTPDALASVQGGRASSSTSGTPDMQTIPLPAGVSLPPPVAPGLPGQNQFSAVTPELVSLHYDGDVAGFLDAVVARFGLSWRTDRGAVVVYRTQTRIFKIFNMPQALSSNSTITSGTTTTTGTSGQGGGSSSGSGGSSGGVSGNSGSNQVTTLTMQTDPAKDLSATIKTMLSTSGQANYSQSSNTLVVTDTPEVLERVEAFVDDYNDTFSKQVLINAKLIAVTISDTDSYGLNWTAIYNDLSKNFGIKLTNAYTAATGAVTGSVNILQGNSHWSGSQALVQALATQGRVRVLTEPSVITRNMKAAPMQVARQTGYIAMSSNTITSGDSGFSQSSLTPGTVTTGFNMNVTPSIFPDNKTVELALSVNLSDLVDIVRKESGNSAIEVPDIDNKIFSQDVQLQSGDTVVVASLKQDSNDNERSGVGSAWNWVFGGGVTGKRNKTYIVIVIQPVVMAGRRTFADATGNDSASRGADQ